MGHPVSSQYPERTSAASVTSHTLWGSQEQEPWGLRWPKRRVSVPYAVIMPQGTTMGCGPVKAAKPSSSGASRVGRLLSFVITVDVTLKTLPVCWRSCRMLSQFNC